MVQSLQKKFIVIIFLSIITFMSGIGYWIVQRESSLMYEELRRKGILLAETLAIPMINDLIYEKLGLVEEGGLIDNYVTEIFEREELNLLYIMVLDVNGRVVSHNDFSKYGNVVSDEITARALEAETTVVSNFQDTGTGHGAMDVSVPLSIGKKRWGTLKLAISLEDMEHERVAVLKKVALITFITLAAGFVWTVALSRRFIRPVTQLAMAMEQANVESLDVRATVRGNDELAMLGTSFNSMMQRIRDANLEIKRSQEKLMQSEKLASIGVLASGVAHEINNPLGGMFNCVNLLRERGESPESRQKYLELLSDGLSRIEGTVGKLLWMSKRKVIESGSLGMRKVIGEVSDFLDYRMKQEGIEFKCDLEESLTVEVDRHDLYQILLNLLLNAIQAMSGRGGRLEVTGSLEGGMVALVVADTGRGIARESLGKIFDPFYTTKGPGEGTGLGLWMTYEIIKSYEGSIEAKSEEGQGATFTIKLKAVRNDG